MHISKQNQPKPARVKAIKIGRPGYKVTRTVENGVKVLYFELQYEDITANFIPKHRVMSAFEQKIEQPDKNYQYLIFSAEPYENVAFKIPNVEIETGVVLSFKHRKASSSRCGTKRERFIPSVSSFGTRRQSESNL